MRARLSLACALALAAPAAQAGETACWYEQGLLVVPASVMGVAGDYLLDTGTAHTQLQDTRARGEGFTEPVLSGEVRLAGVRLAHHRIEVADLDARTGLAFTPIAGVIGADVLRSYVVDVSYAPCRVRLSSRRPRPPREAHAAPLRWIDGRPAVRAAVSDGPTALVGDFVIATSGDRPARLADAWAQAPGARRPEELYPYGVLEPRLRALSFAGLLLEGVPAGLLRSQPGGPLGEIGARAFASYRLTFDFPRGRLWVLPNEKGPPATGGPLIH